MAPGGPFVAAFADFEGVLDTRLGEFGFEELCAEEGDKGKHSTQLTDDAQNRIRAGGYEGETGSAKANWRW